MAQTFYPITPVEVTPGTAGSWQDVDVSAHLGGDAGSATGVILHVVNTSATDYEVGVRKNGSTDNRHSDFRNESHCWAMIGIDSSDIFEAYVENITDVDIYLVGYTMSGVTFKTNADDKSPTAGSWTDIDCSTEAPNAVGLIFEVYRALISAVQAGLRKNGSTDDRKGYIAGHTCLSAVIGCDGSQICEGYIATTSYNFFLSGYITDGATFNTNATDLSLGSTGAWTDLSTLPANSNMGIIEINSASTNKWAYGLRKNGSSEDIYKDSWLHHWGIVETASQVIEGKIEDTEVDFFLVGYATAVTITEKTGSDTGSGTDAKALGNPSATLSKSDTGSGADTKSGYPSALHERSDTGSGVEALVTLLAILIASETGAGVEVVAELAQLTPKTGSDSGSGVESLVARLLAASETGTSLESLLARLLHHTDSGLGSDTCLTLLAALTRAETGSGLDAFTGLTSALTTAEASSGIDELIGREITLPDAGSGLDIAILYKALFSIDSGGGLEALVSLLALTITSEAGSGSEQLRAKIMTSPAAGDMKLPTKKGKAGIPSKRVNL